jgi:UDP-N-acetyl-D-galactosamine dehydrogenase
VIDVVHELQSYGVDVEVVDPHAQSEEVEHEYKLAMSSWANLTSGSATSPVTVNNVSISEEAAIYETTLRRNKYAAVILAVSHKEFLEMDVRQFMLPEAVLYDVKAVLPHTWVDGRL